MRPNQINRYLALWEFAHGAVQVESVPPGLQFARSNICNFKCVYCIDHREGNLIARTRLEGETWDRLAALIPKADNMGFHGISEFFVDPEFFNLVERAAQNGVTLSLNTNGSVCTPRHLEVLANHPAGLWMTFSLDAATPETFKKIRGQDFWRIVDNVRKYVTAFKERRNRSSIWLSFVVNRTNYTEMLPFVYLGKALDVDGLTFFRLHEYKVLDWEVEMKGGGVFNYREQTAGHFRTEFNREIERVRKAVEFFGMEVDLPAPLPEPDLEETK
jgi:molybdenum cofactor biosynthesis enzyme MoaA